MSTATLTIDLMALAANWCALDGLSGNQVQTGAVVKADGYGLGANKVANFLKDTGVNRFFVAVTEEGAHLRKTLGPEPEINIFSGHMQGDKRLLQEYDLIPMLNSGEQFLRHIKNMPKHRFGIQIDTGMNRLGMEPNEWQGAKEAVLNAKPGLLMSHLACADEPGHPMNPKQLKTFHDLTDGLGVERSLSATGGILLGPDYHFDLTRPGVGLYGGLPFKDAQPVVRLSLPVIQERQVLAGETVGYATAWVAKTNARIATVSGGYADGLLRSLGAGAMLFHRQTPCPIVGRISMDLITVDISHLDHPPDTLDILCEQQNIDQLATLGGTIGYEILTSLGPRYKRRYKTA